MTLSESDQPGLRLVDGQARGEILVAEAGLSFWGGVDPRSGTIIDAHHPNNGQSVASKILMMPTSRGSCSGSGVLLELALTGRAPAAMIFCEDEEILTLGALVSARVFGCGVPTLRLPKSQYDRLARSAQAEIRADRLVSGDIAIDLQRADVAGLSLSAGDQAMLDGASGPAARLAMEILCHMAVAEGAPGLMDVTRGHIDGCILAHSANLIFAEKFADMGAKVSIPTTINAISVDRENWQAQGVPEGFGARASRLADAYVRMRARPTFTCAPYLLGDAPAQGECIGWSESNAVIFANSVLGARTAKHPDYLDLCIAITGRAPISGVYTDARRAPRRIIDVALPDTEPGETLWPLLGWLVGRLSPDRIPLVRGLEALRPSRDDLKALCAAFGTTSGVPMLHIAGHTPEASLEPAPRADRHSLDTAALRDAWRELNRAGPDIDLVAIGSPHASLSELCRMSGLFGRRRCRKGTEMIVTIGRDVLHEARAARVADRLAQAGVRLIPDLCWCSITEPVFPPSTRTIMTNSGKYAHYAKGLSGRDVRLGSLQDCVDAAVSGKAPSRPPDWLAG
ncbi:MAG: aconitase family protein [Alphaproteobacteria bacterium]|nr:aconitase family protein [Alphaproteobacteria bacterium]